MSAHTDAAIPLIGTVAIAAVIALLVGTNSQQQRQHKQRRMIKDERSGKYVEAELVPRSRTHARERSQGRYGAMHSKDDESGVTDSTATRETSQGLSENVSAGRRGKGGKVEAEPGLPGSRDAPFDLGH